MACHPRVYLLKTLHFCYSSKWLTHLLFLKQLNKFYCTLLLCDLKAPITVRWVFVAPLSNSWQHTPVNDSWSLQLSTYELQAVLPSHITTYLSPV